MLHPDSTAKSQAALLDRVQSLEEENARLSAELKQHWQREQELLQSNSIGSAFEHAAIGYALVSPDGRFADANPAYCRLIGYSREELRQRRFSDLVHPDDRQANLRLNERLEAHELPSFVVENRYIRKDAQTIFVRKSVSPVMGPDGAPRWFIALVEDITQQRQAEEALRNSERIYRAIGETIPYGIWICDPGGRAVYASQSMLDLLGITFEQFATFGWADFLEPEDRERIPTAWKEFIKTEGLWDMEHRFRGKDGQVHTILGRGVPVRDERGSIVAWAGINLDISALKQREQQVRESEMRVELRRRLLDQREQERLSLARDIHDGPIQTLAALNMELDMARTGADDPAVRRELGRIRRHLRQAMQELRDLVGELRSSLLQSMGLSRALRLHAREFHARHPELDVVCRLTPDRGRLSLYASLSLFRIYQEALNNVARHAGAKRVTVQLSFENDCAVLQVRDNGRGMEGSMDLMEQTSRGHYGIAGMQERVDAVNGTLTWRSRPGKGTTVLARVPLDGASPGPAES